jgi:hypothetical protein
MKENTNQGRKRKGWNSNEETNLSLEEEKEKLVLKFQKERKVSEENQFCR